ncbi:MAG TPA: hypothetical protein VNB06_07125 [Thermoanaerobaculia bacterium]|nr:hypothetical protein [Thermoanaerobaculia bacterium]
MSEATQPTRPSAPRAGIRREPRGLLGALACALLALFAAKDAPATSYVPMSDAALADAAAIAVEVRVLDAAPAVDGAAITYLVEVERVLKGHVPGSTLEVRIPGGPAFDGGWFRVFGAPVLRDGERALLLLEGRADGSYAPSQLMLGAFHRLTVAGRQLLVRDLAEAEELPTADRRRAARGAATPATRQPADRPRDPQAFADWLAARGAGVAEEPDYFVDTSEETSRAVERMLRARRDASLLPERDASEASLLFADDGFPVRWFDFDAGASVAIRSHGSRQEGWDEGVALLHAAVEAWNQAPGAAVALGLAGTTDADGGLRYPDGVNAVLWNDPYDEIPGSFSCTDGGVLAIGGTWFRSELEASRGGTFHRIFEGDVVLQDGAACYLANNQGADGAEVLAHEIGHLLGLGHACGEAGLPSCTEPRYGHSLMRPVLQGSGRGPVLGDDDLFGLLALYAENTNVGGLGVFVPEGDFVLLDGEGEPILLAYGLEGDLPVAGDFDGDGGHTVGVFRNGQFLLHAPNSLADVTVRFGDPGDLPLVGDWDGDGIDTVGVFRDGVFRLRNSHTAGPAEIVLELGASGDLPVAGDWDGDGRDAVGVFQPAAGRFLLLESLEGGAAILSIELGGPGDLPVAGDWNRDGVDSIGVFRDGVFSLRELASGGGPLSRVPIPAATGLPVAGRWGRMQ